MCPSVECLVAPAPSPSLQEGRDKVPGLCLETWQPRDTGRTLQAALGAPSRYLRAPTPMAWGLGMLSGSHFSCGAGGRGRGE